jgi:hypothetical protein
MNPIFARMYKVDEERREIYARAVQEIPDNAGECFDYSSSKPNFQKWSADSYAASGGKSLGNIRAMHGNVAAGLVTDIDFNDTERAVDVVCKIVDDAEWSKCLTGVYTGLSIGGSYQRKWVDKIDGQVVTRYTAKPSEVSLVDKPCVPTARFFEVRKRDGSVIRRCFATNNFVETMNKFQSLLTENGMNKNASVDAIRKIHAQGAQSLPKDLLHKYEATAPKDRTEETIRKIHGTVRANPQIDLDAIFKMARRSAALRKTTFPPNSSNGQWGGRIASTGAGNDWNDEGTVGAAGATPARIGGQVIGTPSKSNMQAALDAIKQDLARGAKRAF